MSTTTIRRMKIQNAIVLFRERKFLFFSLFRYFLQVDLLFLLYCPLNLLSRYRKQRRYFRKHLISIFDSRHHVSRSSYGHHIRHLLCCRFFVQFSSGELLRILYPSARMVAQRSISITLYRDVQKRHWMAMFSMNGKYQLLITTHALTTS